MKITQGILKITSTKEVARNTLLLTFEILAENFQFMAGQFVSMKFGAKAWRAYSIASSPDNSELELVVRLVENGVASQKFSNAQIGDSFDFKGPFGHFMLSNHQTSGLIFCATGTGIAPFKGMIQQESKSISPRTMTLLYGGRDSKDLAYLSEISHWAPHLKVHLGLSQITNKEKDILIQNFPQFQIHPTRITEILHSQVLPSLSHPDSEFYLCGNGYMVKSIQAILHEASIPNEQIFFERFN
ncbi:MAG TPA: hypothetical protein DCX14_03355 [Flavobacteriales bacterium]|nr:hypothetical protein [Flavobacteriales bacterium]